ncbi:MAG: helix-turn-helix domain-containing protein [Candidatus Micrarchaeota archaeon]
MKVTLLQLLRRLGLGKNESAIYALLHESGEHTAGEIAQHTSVPRSKVYFYLDTLVAKGLVLRIPNNPLKFRTSGIAVVKSAVSRENKLLEQLTDVPSQYFPVYLTIGQANVMRQFTVENRKVKKSIISIVRGLKRFPFGINVARTAVKRGVDIRILALDRPDVREIAPLWRKAGVKVKLYRATAPEGLRLTVFDDALVRLTLGKPEIPESENYTTVWIKSKAVAAMCREYFEMKWREAQ